MLCVVTEESEGVTCLVEGAELEDTELPLLLLLSKAFLPRRSLALPMTVIDAIVVVVVSDTAVDGVSGSLPSPSYFFCGGAPCGLGGSMRCPRSPCRCR